MPVKERYQSQRWHKRDATITGDRTAMMIDPRQAEIDRLMRQSREFAREAEIAMSNAGRVRNGEDRAMHLRHATQFRAISENKAETAAEMVRRYGKQLPLPLPSVPKRGGILLKGQ